QLEDGRRLIRGYFCNERGQLLYPDLCPNLTDVELGRDENRPDRLFTDASITWAQLSLVGAWLLFTAGLVAAVAWAVAARDGDSSAQAQKSGTRNSKSVPQARKPVKRTRKAGARTRKPDTMEQEPVSTDP